MLADYYQKRFLIMRHDMCDCDVSHVWFLPLSRDEPARTCTNMQGRGRRVEDAALAAPRLPSIPRPCPVLFSR